MRKLYVWLGMILDKVVPMATKFSMIIMVLLTLVVCIEIVFRSVLNQPIVISSELYMLFTPYVIFMAAVTVSHKQEHIQITFFLDRLSDHMRRNLRLGIHGTMLFFTLYFIYGSWQFLGAVSAQIFPVMRISRAWAVSSMTISFTLIAVILIHQILSILLEEKVGKNKEDPHGLGIHS